MSLDDFERGKREAWLPQRAGATPAELEGRRVAGGAVRDQPVGEGAGMIGLAILIQVLLLAFGAAICAVLAVIGTPILYGISALAANRPKTIAWGRTYVTMCIGVALALVAGLLATTVARSLETYPPPKAAEFATMWPTFMACKYAWPTFLVMEAGAFFFFSLFTQYRLRPAFNGQLGYAKALAASGLSLFAVLAPVILYLGISNPATPDHRDIAAIAPIQQRPVQPPLSAGARHVHATRVNGKAHAQQSHVQ